VTLVFPTPDTPHSHSTGNAIMGCETELVALDVLHHQARLVVAIGRQ
jgi:hypothetical protein